MSPIDRDAVIRAAADRAESVDGMMTRTELEVLARGVWDVQAKRVLEIGSYKGRSTTAILATCPPSPTVVCVDDFSSVDTGREREEPEAGAQAFHDNLRPFRERVISIQKNSRDIRCVRAGLADVFGSLGGHADLTFIDGGHDYATVSADIFTARRFTRPGGIICGHDLNMYDVRAAVTDHFGRAWLGSPNDTDMKIWWVHVEAIHGIQ